MNSFHILISKYSTMKISSLHFVTLFLILLTPNDPCNADMNANIGSECSVEDNSDKDIEFQTNLRNLKNSLIANVPLNNGFYKTEVGKKHQRVYGLAQCRGDISADDCSKCIKNATEIGLTGCQPISKHFRIWFRWCFFRYSNESFFGVLDSSAVSPFNTSNNDDPSVVLKGLDLMRGLASTVPNQPLMFQTAVMDVGQNGKRYGLSQCNRDISKSDCEKCLKNQLIVFRDTIGNQRDWEIYASNCCMLFDDYRFFFNISTTAIQGGARRLHPHKLGAVSILIMAVLELLIRVY